MILKNFHFNLSVLNVFNWVFTVSYRNKRTSYRNLNSLRIWTKLNIHFHSQNKSNSCRKSFSLIGNITPIGLFENPIELSIFSIGNYFSYGKYYFPMGYWFSKVNILPIRWKTLKTNKVIYSLDNDIKKLHPKRVKKCQLRADIIIRHSVYFHSYYMNGPL